MSFPARIICLTEESVETLYLLGREDLIQGVSEYVERPTEAKALPVVTQFIRSDLAKITALKPDLIIGFSDIQKDIARDLIGMGLNVLITNQRSLQEILDNILLLGRIVGEEKKAQELVVRYQRKLDEVQKQGQKLVRKPRVYFEEWDHPRITGITWVSELIEACGGMNIFAGKATSLGKDRIVTDEEIRSQNPEVIFACWCGKKVNLDTFSKRSQYSQLSAVKNGQVWELPPEVFLQPGPALFEAGLDQMLKYFQDFQDP